MVVNGMALGVASALIVVTVVLTVRAAGRVSDTGDHYVAGRRLRGWQNGLALAGDQLSAASFLGITGAVALTGFDGFYLAVGVPTAYLLMLLVFAEPLRNLGRYTLADAVAARFDGRLLRGSVAAATLVMTIIYMVIQFIGAGLLAQLLLGVDFRIAVIVLGVLMTLYTFLGGMVATTYIQVFKTGLLLVAVAALLLTVMSRTGWNPIGSMRIAHERFGDAVVSPQRTTVTAGLDHVSLMLGMTTGMMGLPHVMVRFLTVRDPRAARGSARLAIWIFSVFFLVLPLFGYAALTQVGKARITHDNPAGNLAAPRLAEVIGGNLLFSVIAGVVISVILAVLAGLSIASSGAVAHDLYTNVARRAEATPRQQLVVGRLAGVVIAVIAILLALGARAINVAFLGNVAFAIAASTTMPVLLLTIYWRGFNRVGATSGLIGGLVCSVGLVVVGPDVLGTAHLFPLSIPAIVSIPFAFACAWVGSLIGRRDPAAAGADYRELAACAFATTAE